ncbi:MAG: hypothetical protein OXC25_07735 [Thiotrichales bacterium]|nr:hypothetical protein [Thiotrichales bacterium]
MARYLHKPRLATPGYRNTYPMRWRAACDEIATDVYAFRDWERVYREAFGHRLPATVPSAGTERDGIRHARTGEGPNHRALRLWIEKNPRRVRRAYAAHPLQPPSVMHLDSLERDVLAIDVFQCFHI